MIVLSKFNCFFKDLCQGKHNFSSHVFKAMFLSAGADPVLDLLKADVTEISAGNGYTAGGLTINILSVNESGGYVTVLTNDPSVVTTGSVGPIWGIAVYNDTATNDPLMFYANFPTGVTLPNGITWPIGIDTDLGLFRGS